MEAVNFDGMKSSFIFLNYFKQTVMKHKILL